VNKFTPVRIRIEIEELVLHGFDPRDRHRIGEALRAELTRLVDDSPSILAAQGADRIDGGSFTVTTGADGGAIGRGAAGALHRSITSCR
jgi:hypothetical protein